MTPRDRIDLTLLGNSLQPIDNNKRRLEDGQTPSIQTLLSNLRGPQTKLVVIRWRRYITRLSVYHR